MVLFSRAQQALTVIIKRTYRIGFNSRESVQRNDIKRGLRSLHDSDLW